MDIVRMLVTKGARVDGVTTGGWSPLMVAAAFNRLETASYLLSASADRRKTNNDGASAEVIAAGKGFVQMVEKLRDGARALAASSSSASS